jgi:hypothetical protein
MVMKAPFDEPVERSKSCAELIAAMAPTYGLTAGYRNVAMAVSEPSLRQNVFPPGKLFLGHWRRK